MNISASNPPSSATYPDPDNRPSAPIVSVNRKDSSTESNEIGLHSITAGAVAGATIGLVVPVVGSVFGASLGAGLGFVVGMAAKEAAEEKKQASPKDSNCKPLLESDEDED